MVGPGRPSYPGTVGMGWGGGARGAGRSGVGAWGAAQASKVKDAAINVLQAASGECTVNDKITQQAENLCVSMRKVRCD